MACSSLRYLAVLSLFALIFSSVLAPFTSSVSTCTRSVSLLTSIFNAPSLFNYRFRVLIFSWDYFFEIEILTCNFLKLFFILFWILLSSDILSFKELISSFSLSSIFVYFSNSYCSFFALFLETSTSWF